MTERDVRLRCHLPRSQSVFMDRSTLLNHRQHWLPSPPRPPGLLTCSIRPNQPCTPTSSPALTARLSAWSRNGSASPPSKEPLAAHNDWPATILTIAEVARGCPLPPGAGLSVPAEQQPGGGRRAEDERRDHGGVGETPGRPSPGSCGSRSMYERQQKRSARPSPHAAFSATNEVLRPPGLG